MNPRRAAALAQPGVYKFLDANSVAFLAFPGTPPALNTPAPNARYLTLRRPVTTTRTVRLRANWSKLLRPQLPRLPAGSI